METGLEIAVIGMAGRFPGARDIHEFWENVKNNVESIAFFSEEELMKGGARPRCLGNPKYVKAGGMLPEIEYFDAPFFGYTPTEAGIMDPQVRIFHECTWTALENAGYDPMSSKGLIGLYAGASPNLKWIAGAMSSGNRDVLGDFDASQLIEKEYLCMRVSYKLNLSGPSVLLYTACSTSLVAIHMGYQALLNGECDISLAGGVTIIRAEKAGYVYKEGMINSPDGHCRAFDAGARGFAGADGVGVVVLRRLRDAISAGDHIYAVIKGSAVNNDGMQKAGFTAPSVKGQAEVIRMAMQMAGVEPETIGYVETHGTGTELGDPVEIEGLKRAFNTGKKGYCGIGSVKTNLGHMDAAAGAAGFIKVALALKHRQIPSTLYFETPNPRIDFINSPFYVNTIFTPWENHGRPLRAGVSSFGQGGTNAHIILEEWPEPVIGHSSLVIGENKKGRENRLIVLSAKTETALEKMTENLARHFKKNPHLRLRDVAFTLLAGRHAFKYRKMAVCATIPQAVEILEKPGSPGVHTHAVQEENRPVIFIIPQEKEEEIQAQYKRIGEILNRQKTLYREEMNRCLENSKSPTPGWFIFQYALAKMLMHGGINPYAVIGEGRGETLAKCLTGEISLENALKSAASTPTLDMNDSNPAMHSFTLRLKELAKLPNPVFVYIGSKIEKIEKILAGDGGETGHRVGLLRSPANPAAMERNITPVTTLEKRADDDKTRRRDGSSPGDDPDLHFLMTRIGRLWLYGINLDWEKFNTGEPGNRIPLPTYPFESRRYWIDEISPPAAESTGIHPAEAPKKPRSHLYPRPGLSSEYIPPTGPTEMKLAGIWQEFFGFEQIGIQDDFFEMGGDSLKVINLITQIQKEMEVSIPIPEFFDRPTIGALSGYIRENPQKSRYAAIEPVEEREYYPLALTQRRLYILQQADPGNIAYNIPDIYQLDVKVDLGKFREIFMKMIRRQESFRTSFGIVNGEPVQRIHGEAEVDYTLEYYDVTGKEGETADAIIKKFIRPFDLSCPSLLRAGIIKIAEEKNLLMTDMHHLISDGISVIITVRDFLLLYGGSELPGLPVQYKDFAVWQLAEKEKGALKKQEEYWLKEFQGDIPQLRLPLDYARPPVRDFEGSEIIFGIDAAATRGLAALAESENATLFMVLLAVYSVLLSRLSGQEQIIVGTGVAGRTHEELMNLVGTFINTTPLKTFPARGKTFKAFLKETREKALQAFANQDYPFEDLVEKVVPIRDRGRNPLFDVFLMSLVMDRSGGTPSRESQDGPPKYPAKYEYDTGVSKFDIGLLYWESGDKLELVFEYRTCLFKRETIERFISFFKDIVSVVTANKNIPLGEIEISHSLLTASEDVIPEAPGDFEF